MTPLTLPGDWPLREASRRIACKPHLWHVQELGSGPLLLLLHGAGGATHSWRNLIPLLAGYRVVAIDLPGQGFTRMGSRRRCSIEAMAEDIASLCANQGWQPHAVIGHSAGGALALRLAEVLPVARVVGINAALGTFDGAAGWLFPLMAKLLAATPMVPQLFSRLSGTPDRVEALLASTGSKIDEAGRGQYLRLLQMSNHVDATLLMMAQWKLDGLLARLPEMAARVLLITGAADATVPPGVSERAAVRSAGTIWVNLPGLGHLAHEEDAAAVAAVVLPFLA
jgi:magnesium chelatase accessory protein